MTSPTGTSSTRAPHGRAGSTGGTGAATDADAEALAFAGELVARCGLQARERQAGVVERTKPGGSLAGTAVTDVDVDLERLVDEALAQRYPDDALIGEEGTERAGTSGRTWVVDPVDGTLNYARRCGVWSVVLCAWEGETPVLAAVWTDGRLYTALRGRGAHLDGERLTLGPEAERGGIVRTPAALAPVVDAAGWLTRTVESSAAEVVAVADGRFTGGVRLRGDRRDLHGPALVAEEAGATVTDLDGGPWSGASRGLVLAHPGAHAALLDLVRTAREQRARAKD